MLKLQLINRYTVYRGGKELIGTAEEVKLPEITSLTDTVGGAGFGGNMTIPVIGLVDDMEMEIPFMSLCNDVFSLMDPTQTADITLNGAIQGMDGGDGSVGYKPVSISVRGTVKKFVPGSMKSGAKMGSSVTLGLSYYKVVLDGKTVLEIDKLNGVYVVNGNDVLREVRDMC